MIWSNWQGAIGRGAALTLLLWSGLAWTQTPPLHMPANAGERIMWVHEGGKSIRCKVNETWQLPDKRIANLLQALETGELITIVDDPAPPNKGDTANPRKMPKRIYPWGLGQVNSPEGAPPPPQRDSSRLVTKNDAPRPFNPVLGDRPIPDKAPGIGFGVPPAPPAPKGSSHSFPPVISKTEQPTRHTAPANSAGLSSVPFTLKELPCDDLWQPCDSCGPVVVKRPPAFPRLRTMMSRFKPDAPLVPAPGSQANVLAGSVAPGRLPFGGMYNQATTPGNPNPSGLQPNVGVPNQTTQLEYPIPTGTQPSSRAFGPAAQAYPRAPGRLPFGGLFKHGMKANDLVAPSALSNAEVLGQGAIGSPFTPDPQPNATVLGQGPSLGSPFTPTIPSNPIATGQGPAPGNPGTSGRTMDGLFNHQGTKGNHPTMPAAAPSSGSLVQGTPLVRPNPPAAPPAAPTPLAIRSNERSPTVPTVDPKAAKAGVNPAVNPPVEAGDKKSWRPGDRLQAWFKPAAATPKAGDATAPRSSDALSTPFAKSSDLDRSQKTADLLSQQNKAAQKLLEQRVTQIYKTPFSTAMSTTPMPNMPRPEMKTPASSPLAMPVARPTEERTVILPPPSLGNLNVGKVLPMPTPETREMWGHGPVTIAPPGKSVLEQAIRPTEIVKLPAPVERRNDPLMHPERITPVSASMPAVLPPEARPTAEQKTLPQPEELKSGPPSADPSYPLNSQSVLASRSGLQGPVMYVPVPVVTVPQPNNPPAPPPPTLPSPPQLNMYVNAFSPPPQPKGAQPSAPPQGMSGAFANPMMTQQMMHQQMMHQQMMQQQQQMLAQQQMMGNPMMPYMTPTQPTNPMMAQGYGAPMPSAGPMTNYGRHYSGPLPPNPMMQAGYGQMPYPPSTSRGPNYGMMPQQPIQPMGYQQPMSQPSPAQQLDQLMRVLRESPYPAQREWAAQSLASFDWRSHPQVVPSLLQSARQDPAGSVRAGSVTCLSRIGAAVEPVFATLQTLRNDPDPRVRQEVEQAFMRLGQTPTMPR